MNQSYFWPVWKMAANQKQIGTLWPTSFRVKKRFAKLIILFYVSFFSWQENLREQKYIFLKIWSLFSFRHTSHSAYVAMSTNCSELRLMDSKSKFYVDSKNVSEKFLHCYSSKNCFFFHHLLWGTKWKNLQKIFSEEWQWRNFLIKVLDST